MSMNNKVLIIGGNSGIGKSIVEQLKAKGSYEIITASRNNEEGGENHHNLDILEDSPEFPLIEGPLSALIYCPGSIQLKPFKQLTLESFRSDMEINTIGLVKALQHYEKALKEGGASIVAFSTVAVSQGMPFHSSVAMAKGALEGLIKSLAAEWAPSVRLNVIAPSLTETPMAARLLRNEKQITASNERHPLKRIGKPEDVANAAVFLIEDQSSWITGQIFHVDGGMSAIKI